VRIPFPERVPINRVAIFAAALFLIQMMEGTALYFSVGCVAFILIAAFAFNAAGGLTRTSGAYIFSYSVLVFIIGICYKAFLGEPAQSNLHDPLTDIEAYVGTIAALYAAVIVSRRFRRKAGLLENLLKESDMYRASVGCFVFGVGGAFLIAILGDSAARLQTAFGQLNQLIPLGIIIGVMYEVRRSGGTRCTNLFVTLGAAYFFFLGMTGFSKQGMIEPFYSWLLPVCALRYRLSAVQLLSCLLAVFVMFHYLTPFSQYGRGLVPEQSTLSQRVAIAIPLLEHPEETRRIYEEQENANLEERGLAAYYNTPQGFWERLQMISPDDKLISVTDQGKVFGLLPLKAVLLNAVPHIFWPNKPNINIGNSYAHEITGEEQGEGDITTGIAFSPTGEAYHMAKWVGVLVIAPLLWCLLFIVYDALLGDLRVTPWGLLALVVISHVAPEGGINVIITLLTFGVEILVFCAFFSAWFAPVIATVVLGADRKSRPFPVSPRLSPLRLVHAERAPFTFTAKPPEDTPSP
jgi:hypothetical protein